MSPGDGLGLEDLGGQNVYVLGLGYEGHGLSLALKGPDIFSVCSGCVVVSAYDFESGRPGSNPEWELIYFEASITVQGLPEPSSPRGSTLGTRAAEHTGCNWACKLIDGCSQALCSATVSVVSAGICHRNEVFSIA